MKITADGITRVMGDMRAMILRARDLSLVMSRVTKDVRKVISDAFRSESDPNDGKPWKPLAASTLDRRRQGKNKSRVKAKILTNTGTLAGSITVVPSTRSILFGTNVPYGASHQLGGGPSKNRPPIRKFLPEQFDTGPSGVAGNKLRRRIINWLTKGTTEA